MLLGDRLVWLSPVSGACPGGSLRREREEVAERSRMFEGDGAFPRQPIYGGKDLGPGIARQQDGQFLQRTGPDPGELLLNGRFKRVSLCHVMPHKKRSNE